MLVHLFVEKLNNKTNWMYCPHIKYNKEYNHNIDNDLAAILANATNVEVGEKFVPISKQKGVPKDISAEVSDMNKRFSGSNYRSHSFLSLKEILDFDWNRFIIKVHTEYYIQYTTHTYDHAPGRYSTRTEYPHTIYDKIFYKNAVGNFYTDFIPKLKQLADDSKLDN
jgi:hypothetical protein